jgi:hypothetical protein
MLQGPIPLQSINPFWCYTAQEQASVTSIVPTDPHEMLAILQERIEVIQTPAQADMIIGELQVLNQRLLYPMQPPTRQVTQGRPPGVLNRVIKRDSSAFEVALSLPCGVPVNNRRCMRCNVVGTGHNSAT